MSGVHLGNLDVSGKSKLELHAFLTEEVSRFENAKFPLFTEDGTMREEIELSFRELGISYDLAATEEAVYQTGRRQTHAQNLLFRLRMPFVKTVVKPVYAVNTTLFASRLDTALAKYVIASSDATIIYEKGAFAIQEEKPGKIYDRELLVDNIRDRVENFSLDPILVAFTDVVVQVESERAGPALEKVKTLQTQKVSLAFGNDRWSLTGNSLLSILDFKPKGIDEEIFELNLGSGPVLLSSLGLVGGIQRDLEVILDEESLSKFVDNVGGSIDVETVDASLVFDGERATQFTPARDGQKLNREQTRELLLAKVSVDNVSGEREIIINLPVAVTRAKIASEEINSLGIRELVGGGVSYFAGSIPNRVHNLSLGSQRISGTIVKPGEIFSFNKTVGDVSGSSGYKPAYVISSGRTVLDDGGGICQVSTTLFRAALNAGLPIVSRTAHAYRVGYYEQRGFKAGLDATVWAPAVDLAFKNDTDQHILVQAVVDRTNAKLKVDIYGTSDGRRVELTDPVISNIRPAPEDKYQDEPSLPKGTVKQVDFSAQGATSVFSRKVYRGDQLIIDDTFKSNFRPWQAVYLVGTGG